ncbi:MAG: bifunctional UDP-N-acetylmuramoyl-tripeptide:D-alanyl-D-alanine ligase/alanine racemase [Bacteroidales bacterium]|nr:bifunctional UDP-N-acetylmuramoyl-tripeptide:D-alanyl-D-alanine ligase/alanine racemase [Bacteroidales bacterium]
MQLAEIIAFINPEETILGTPECQITELAIDSRKVTAPERTLFFAIETEKNDGHLYIPSLYQLGVRNFVITKVMETYAMCEDANFLFVEDSVAALQRLAQKHRQQFHYPVIGITGSNGKTIVKEWLTSILDDKFKVVKSPDSYNSRLGVPLSVWQMSDQHDIAVFEAGISRPNEMRVLADIIDPTIGILTNIGAAHAQFFPSNNRKIIEKLKLFRNVEVLIYHNDNEELNMILQLPEYARLNKISWGDSRSTYPVQMQAADSGGTIISLDGFNYTVPFIDSASLENVTHVIVTLLYVGFTPEEIDSHLGRLTHISMRLEILEGRNHSVIVNDTYSLDINSLSAALNFLDTQTQMTKKTLVISDFEQVGQLAEEDFRRLNAQLKRHHISRLIAVGSSFEGYRGVFDLEEQLFYHDTADLLDHLSQLPISYEIILVKGARNFHFEQVVNALQHKTHLTIMQVNLPALAYNLNFHRNRLRPDTKMVAMVKASSYGLGDVELVNTLLDQGIDYLAVAYTDEGVRLRKRRIDTPIIVLGAEAHSFEVMVNHRLEPEIFNFYYLQQLEEVLARHPEIPTFNIHVKLDTGMHRLGFDMQDIPRLIDIVKRNPKLRIASVFSHLAAAEDPAEDAFTRRQIALFGHMTDVLCAAFDYKILRHILNSAGIIRFPEAQFDMVRLGIQLYGCSEIPEMTMKLHNVVTLKTVITQIKQIPAGETIGYNRTWKLQRDTQVAIIPIGYADGYPRELCNGRGKVLVQGQKVPVIGKICMDMCMLDITGLRVHEGDEVIVYGEGNTVSEMAAAAGLISYELMTRISQRVPRVYVQE